MLRHRLWLFDAVMTPTMNYTLELGDTQKNERMIQSTPCKMLRLIIQTKWKYKKDR